MFKKKGFWITVISAVIIFSIIGSNSKDSDKITSSNNNTSIVPTDKITNIPKTSDNQSQNISTNPTDTTTKTDNENKETRKYNGNSYEILEVDGGNLSGERQSNVVVDVGYGDREYWAYTNEHGQLVYVTADKIVLQDDKTEDVNSNGRYYDDEAKVPGVEDDDLDEGHIIADSLGGVSNAYNITPQNSTLNRYGDQAYMEKVIRDAGGCTDFVATITYPDIKTQIPSHYHYEYVLKGENIVDDFDNIDPDKVNSALVTETPITEENSFDEKAELKRIDKNGNGKVTIAEAKAAGYSMPIYSDEWLYKYMDDRDHDGMVGE